MPLDPETARLWQRNSLDLAGSAGSLASNRRPPLWIAEKRERITSPR
jgi:hypothetical protein